MLVLLESLILVDDALSDVVLESELLIECDLSELEVLFESVPLIECEALLLSDVLAT